MNLQNHTPRCPKSRKYTKISYTRYSLASAGVTRDRPPQKALKRDPYFSSNHNTTTYIQLDFHATCFFESLFLGNATVKKPRKCNL